MKYERSCYYLLDVKKVTVVIITDILVSYKLLK